MNRKLLFVLGIIFFLALFLRFLFFPENVYFGFDQARDAYSSLEIYKGNLRLVGPPTSGNLFHHGVLYYYIFGFIYTLFSGNPEAVSVFLRILNAGGVFVVFLIAKVIFDTRAGIFSALLFALSYEQTQFSLYLNHPSLAVVTVLIFYLGLAVWIFSKKLWGLFLALFGLGLSIQFEFVELQLVGTFLLFVVVFRRKLLFKLNIKNLLFCVLAFIIPISTYLLSEIKTGFYTIKNFPLIFSNGGVGGVQITLGKFIFFINRFLEDNLFFFYPISAVTGIILLFLFLKYVSNESTKDKMAFLFLWFAGGFLIYFVTNDDAYYYNIGTSVSLLIFASFIFHQVYRFRKSLALVLITIVAASNFYLIGKNNPLGPNQKINPQKGLLLSDEKRVVDFIYVKSQGEEFAVNAVTMPFNINTTWSYLFEWYGQKKYGYLPVWGGDAAEGYPGNLKVNNNRKTLPKKRFLVIEPKEGIPSYMIDKFLLNEGYFSTILEKKKIGTLEVWVQEGS